MGCFIQSLFVDPGICAIMLTLTVMDSTGVVAGRVATSQLQGLGFDPDLGLLSVGRVHVGYSRFSWFPPSFPKTCW